MDVKDVSLPTQSKLMQAYLKKSDQLDPFFDYTQIDENTFAKRLKYLQSRDFKRKELVDYLLRFNQKYKATDRTISTIKRLLDPRSVTVVGGQQAGLLTGPLYTVHKIISILHESKKQEELLGVPVIPIFWVAGEDHDFEEINHSYLSQDNKIKKVKIGQKQYKKEPASRMEIDKDKCRLWIRELFRSFKETRYTNGVMEEVEDCLMRSATYVDFFVELITLLFPDDGVVLLDSNDPELRKLESPFFLELLEKNEALSHAVTSQQSYLKELGFGEPIEINENNAHLFILSGEERLLLEKDNEKRFFAKNRRYSWDELELIEIAKENPSQFSNNVVTRPLMQEFLLPVLTFIGGPGEIAYWATLKKAFHLFHFEMPPLLPRISITLVERNIEALLSEINVNIEDVLAGKVQNLKQDWLGEQEIYNIDQQISRVVQEMEKLHLPLRELAVKIDPNLQDLTQKNATMIENQLLFLKGKMEASFRQLHSGHLNKFDQIEMALYPLNNPQERIWNIFYFINKYGLGFIDELTKLEMDCDGKHRIIYI